MPVDGGRECVSRISCEPCLLQLALFVLAAMTALACSSPLIGIGGVGFGVGLGYGAGYGYGGHGGYGGYGYPG